MITSATRIATEQTSALFCAGCQKFFSIEQGEMLVESFQVQCDACGKTTYSAECAGAAIRAQDAHLIDEEAVLSTTWFHVSARADWATDILEPTAYQRGYRYAGESTLMVHLGSIEATKDRARHLSGEDTFAEAFYLYEVRLAPETLVGSAIMADEGNSWPEVTALCGASERGCNYERFVVGATRYINSFEAAGSISIITDAPSVQVISRIQIHPLSFMPI